MCTNRALTDLYAFSARFIQLLNRKLAYVCIADYYKSEQNVLFCLTLIIIFMNSYPLGVYNEKAGSITFPANSLYVSMADYQDGGAYPCTNPSYLYLSAEAYLNSLETE